MGRSDLGLREQAAYMKLWWPCFKSSVRKGNLISEGDLHPSDISRTYRIRVSQAGGRPPRVRVLDPSLKPREEGEMIPHMYEQERLCLYRPAYRQWTSEMPIALTIVPWASTWLLFYELWHATGEWLGGGEEPYHTVPYRRNQEDERG
jgi:hypothetical protein